MPCGTSVERAACVTEARNADAPQRDAGRDCSCHGIITNCNAKHPPVEASTMPELSLSQLRILATKPDGELFIGKRDDDV